MTKRIMISMKEEFIERIDKCASNLEMNRTQFIVFCCLRYLDDVKKEDMYLKAWGVLQSLSDEYKGDSEIKKILLDVANGLQPMNRVSAITWPSSKDLKRIDDEIE